MTLEFTQLMAHYNQLMNQRMYQAASRLGVGLLMKDHGAFFGSVFGTLQHIAVADTIWLLRFATHPGGFASLVTHFFNHQTHHRGQASTLIHQLGVDVGVTDLVALIPEAVD